MSRKPRNVPIDADNPEWSEADVARAKTFDQLSASLQATLSTRRRGPQKAPTKVRTALRLSPEVVEHFKGTGPGWQTRIDATLRELIARPAVDRARAGKTTVKHSAGKSARRKPGVRGRPTGRKTTKR